MSINVDDSHPPIEFGEKLAIIHDPTVLCWGKRIGGTKVCLKTALESKTLVHNDKAEDCGHSFALVKSSKYIFQFTL